MPRVFPCVEAGFNPFTEVMEGRNDRCNIPSRGKHVAVDCLILTIGIRQGLTSLSVTQKRGSTSGT